MKEPKLKSLVGISTEVSDAFPILEIITIRPHNVIKVSHAIVSGMRKYYETARLSRM